MRTMKPLIAILGATALVAATAVPVAAQDGEVPDLQARVDEFVGLLPGGVAAVTIKDGAATTAAAGIADADGTPFSVDTPVLLGGVAVTPLDVLPLQLAEDGLLDLDELVTTYLPGAPVGEGATVRDLLALRAGLPLPPGPLEAALEADPERIFTTDDLVRDLSQGEASSVGELGDGYLNTLIVVQLVEAVTDTDLDTVLAEMVTGPLGMSATRRPDGDPEAIGDVAAGWIESAGEPVYLPNTSNASRTLRPTVTSAGDLATYLAALAAGEVISPELLESTVFDESLELYGYGLSRPDDFGFDELNRLAPSGTRWFGNATRPGPITPPHTGTTSVALVSPDTGDVLVVVTNNADLDANTLARGILADWDAGASTTANTANLVQGTLQYVALLLCDAGQPSGFDLAPCAADDEGLRIDFHASFESTGALDGTGSINGFQLLRPDGTWGGGGTAIFTGEVEDCGTGTVHFLIGGNEGFYDEDGMANYTQHPWEVVPGGTLPLSGSLDARGVEYWPNDYSTAFDFVGELTCSAATG